MAHVLSLRFAAWGMDRSLDVQEDVGFLSGDMIIGNLTHLSSREKNEGETWVKGRIFDKQETRMGLSDSPWNRPSRTTWRWRGSECSCSNGPWTENCRCARELLVDRTQFLSTHVKTRGEGNEWRRTVPFGKTTPRASNGARVQTSGLPRNDFRSRTLGKWM